MEKETGPEGLRLQVGDFFRGSYGDAGQTVRSLDSGSGMKTCEQFRVIYDLKPETRSW